ncbi:TRAP transporter small permease [Pannonibacter sp. Q-1]|uniref:TRAP transporter small permease protein n=2 Tax=Pannonibacter TaxID=227873 RepID=A0A0L0IWG8_9HYPH|nr:MULTISPECIES: TRAP transporter small permease [Pannonibacter]ALV28083.1 ABC transporter substrate-binding protein [Pannonibacter phragmitetus]KND17623.1 ABC transporter substrate-binding protein [Pannonibacter phragmitetus]MBA4205457.1 TRAP transporter small permease [Polymorphum sp.]CUA92007.1 TRAP-type C4-dicarboxylate transport system, small permease component [Pannonibacter indicus]
MLERSGHALLRVLDGLYRAGAVLAAISLVMILVIIVAQMGARWLGITFPGAANYAGYAMASASFLAFAHALKSGTHIRVGLLLNLAGRHVRWVEAWCLAIGSALGWYLTWYAVKAVYWSRKLHDISQGQDQTPLWIPQSAMAAGAALLAIALTESFFRVLVTGRTGIAAGTGEQSHAE